MYSVSVFAARLSNVYINHTVYILARRTSQSSPQALYNWMHLIKAWLVWFHGKLHGGMLSKEGFNWRDCSSYQCDLRQLSTKHALCSGCISNMSLSLRFLLWNCSALELKCQNLYWSDLKCYWKIEINNNYWARDTPQVFARHKEAVNSEQKLISKIEIC